MGTVIKFPAHKTAALNREIYVSGLKRFDARQWEVALNYYVAGMWRNEKDVTYLPLIQFGPACLRLAGETYVAYGAPPDELLIKTQPGRLSTVGEKQADVELALYNFATSRKVGLLVIRFADETPFVLWRKEGGEYGCWLPERTAAHVLRPHLRIE